MDVSVIPVKDHIGSAEETRTKSRKAALLCSQYAYISSTLPDEVLQRHTDSLSSEGKVNGDALRDLAIHGVEIGAGYVLCGRECGDKLVEDSCWKCAQYSCTVDEHRLALASLGGFICSGDRAVLLTDRDLVYIDPVSCEAVGGLFGGNDGKLDEISNVFLGVDSAKDQ
jgi:hypothetical protein